MLTVYGLFFYGLMVSVMIMRKVDQKKLEEAIKLNKKMATFTPFIGIILFLALLILA